MAGVGQSHDRTGLWREGDEDIMSVTIVLHTVIVSVSSIRGQYVSEGFSYHR